MLMLSCRKATELMEKELHFKLSFIEKIQLRMHTSMCHACSAYQKNNILLEKKIKNHVSSPNEEKQYKHVKLSEDFKKELVKNLENNQ